MGEKYLRSRIRRGRWFHYYRRPKEKEKSLNVHGLLPSDPRVKAEYFAEHARREYSPPKTITPHKGTFSWGLDLYTSGNWKWLNEYAEGTKKSRKAIFKRYVEAQGNRLVSQISPRSIETALYAKGGHGAVNEYKALKPVFEHLKRLGHIRSNPMSGIQIEKPKPKEFPTADIDDVSAFISYWEVGTVQRLIFDLALYTGAARVDLAHLGRHNIKDGVLVFDRKKTGVTSYVPLTEELKSVISRTPDISPTFILSKNGKPYKFESIGNMFGEAAKAAGMKSRLHGLRKAFCVYWAEKGKTTHQIAAMAGHLTLKEVERYTRAADRENIVRLIMTGS